MTIFEHLAELRRRLIFAGLGIIVGMAVAAFFLTWPVIGLLTEPVGADKLQVIRPTETFVTYMKVALATGAGLAMPIIVWQSLLFVLPALHPHERRYLFFAVPAITFAFACGLAFGLRVVVPAAVRFLMGFGSEFVDVHWTLDEYLSFVSSFLFWIGVSFETPIVMFFLAKLRVVTFRQLVGFWKAALIGAFVIGAVITPTPDPFNQTIVSLPIFGLYLLGLAFARFA
jgi:sec-independent protein translocase protein TatC